MEYPQASTQQLYACFNRCVLGQRPSERIVDRRISSRVRKPQTLCAVLWRRKRRTTALRWMFLAQLAGNLVLAGLALLSIVKLEHGYDWLILSILLNIVFTPLAFGAAIYDFVHGERRAT